MEFSGDILTPESKDQGVAIHVPGQQVLEPDIALHTLAPSVRFWPTVSSTLANDEFIYLNKITGDSEKIETLDAGFGFTPLVINISVGYSFSIKRNR